jgi:hypothetical protein
MFGNRYFGGKYEKAGPTALAQFNLGIILAIYGPTWMIYTALYVMLLMRANPLGPKWPKKSRFPGPNPPPPPLAQVMDEKHYIHGPHTVCSFMYMSFHR